MSINTLDNKKLLWSTLQTNKCFEGLNDNTFSPVKQQFETIIEQTDKKYKSKINKNKEVLSEMIGFIKNVKIQQEMKTPTPRPAQELTPKTEQIPQQPSITIREPNPTAYKREDMQTQRQQMFEERLKKRQAEFTSLLHGNKPQPIDFADKNEDNPELVGNILKESENFVKQRELDLAHQKETTQKLNKKIKKQQTQKQSTEKTVTPSKVNTMSAGDWLAQKAVKFLKIDNTPKNSEVAQREKDNIVIDLSEKQPEKQTKKKVSFQNVKHIIEEVSPPAPTIKTKLISPPPKTESIVENKVEQKLDLILESVKSLQNQINELKSETRELKNTTNYLKLNQIEQSVSSVSQSVIETVLENMKTPPV